MRHVSIAFGRQAQTSMAVLVVVTTIFIRCPAFLLSSSNIFNRALRSSFSGVTSGLDNRMVLPGAAEGHPVGTARGVSLSEFIDWSTIVDRIPLRRARKDVVPVDSHAEFKRMILEEGCSAADLDVRGDVNRAMNLSSAHPVLRAIRNRLDKTTNRSSDGLRIGLAIEGGGMSGCVAAGMAAALWEHGFGDAIDVVYGSSAGSLVGAYFVSGQMPYVGPEIYYHELADTRGSPNTLTPHERRKKKFINRASILRYIGLGALDFQNGLLGLMKERVQQSLFDVRYLLDSVVQKIKPLDWGTFWRKQTDKTQPLKIVCSGLLSQQPVVLSAEQGNFRDFSTFKNCIEAALHVPGVSNEEFKRLKGDQVAGGNVATTYWPEVNPSKHHRNKVIAFGGEPMVDALLFEPIPYRSAIRDNCTHVLVLRTFPDNHPVLGKLPLIQNLVINKFFGSRFPALHQWMLKQVNKLILAEDMLILNAATNRYNGTAEGGTQLQQQHNHDPNSAEGVAGNPAICALAIPDGSDMVRRLEMSQEKLLNGVRNGYAAVHNMLFAKLVNGTAAQDWGYMNAGYLRAREVWPDSVINKTAPSKPRAKWWTRFIPRRRQQQTQPAAPQPDAF